eukprot:TRINITY_DN3090_c0_g1_i2.p2 TRINITY_DN3090_c0_g1~~TRINITY_DN3090_c0_g1_i2.p2  ORF type:complete len:106 (-),score=26.91 TRINITY_DN3090_c0_g1_i2:102-419(-)
MADKWKPQPTLPVPFTFATEARARSLQSESGQHPQVQAPSQISWADEWQPKPTILLPFHLETENRFRVCELRSEQEQEQVREQELGLDQHRTQKQNQFPSNTIRK